MPQVLKIISAPSILGLKPTGVEFLSSTLLSLGLEKLINVTTPVVHVEPYNINYNPKRDEHTQCLNPQEIQRFSLWLMEEISLQLATGVFPIVLGGDCSILLGIMPALKQNGKYGLIFVDAHADFYAPEQSTTGEVADMDLAIVTGGGPDILSNIKGLKPYVEYENVIHIGQRDEEETKKYKSDDISQTNIKCFSLSHIRSNGLKATLAEILQSLSVMETKGFWLHFDADVIADNENPAVEYRLPGGLTFDEIKLLLRSIIQTGQITGMTVTIYNPLLDTEYVTGKRIVDCLSTILK